MSSKQRIRIRVQLCGENCALTPKSVNQRLDVAMLFSSEESPSFLNIGSMVNVGKNSKCLAVTSFSISMTNQLKEFPEESFTVAPPIMLKNSSHHLVYSSCLFSGDSGGAIIHTDDGNVIGMHLETVNEALEKMNIDSSTMEDRARSINSLVEGTRSAFLGIMLSCDEILKMINAID